MKHIKESLTDSGLNPTDRTRLIQAAIDDSHSAGGGIVRIPMGRHVVTTIELKSRVELHLEHGAIIEAEPDIDLYPILERGHNEDRQPYHLIYASGQEDIALTGPGTVFGNGMAFWEPEPPQDAQFRGMFYKAKDRRVSPMVDFRGCRRVRVDGVTLRDSPGWTLHLFDCDSVVVDRVTVDNHMFGPNTDGFDINGCRMVRVSNCELRGCDDNIIIKATEDARSCEHISVTNCILESNCAALGIGAETWSSIRHVSMSNCTILNALRMIQIIMWDGGVVEDVVITNVTGKALTPVGTDRVIHLDIQEHLGENPVLGAMRNVIISNVTAQTRGRILMTAQDGALMENITLRDIHLTYPEIEDPELTIPANRSTQLSNFSPQARVARAAVVADNIKGLFLDNIVTSWPQKPNVPMFGLWTRKVEGIVRCPRLKSSFPSLPDTCSSDSALRA